MDITQRPGNPAYGLEQAYDKLMVIQDPEALKQAAIDVVGPYVGRGMSRQHYRKFEFTMDSLDTVLDIQKYITNFILKASDEGVIGSRGAYESAEGVQLCLAEDEIDAVASWVAEDPDDKLYNELTDDQIRIKELVESHGFSVKIMTEEDAEIT